MKVFRSRFALARLAALSLALLCAACAAPRTAPMALPAAGQFDLVSEQGRTYRIFLSVPSQPPPPAGYPVLYALDGNAIFPTLAMLARLQGARAADSGIAEGVVVGIGYPTDAPLDVDARAYDDTPPASDLRDTGDPKRAQGGAAQFAAFIAQRLKPEIERRVPIDRQRQTLFGHSYGGLFTLYSLLADPGAYQRYVAASPSIWWNDRYVLRWAERLPPADASTSQSPTSQSSTLQSSTLQSATSQPPTSQPSPSPSPSRSAARPSAPSLLLTVGSLETNRRGGVINAAPQADARQFVDALARAGGVCASLRELPGETHLTAWFAAAPRAIEFAFSGSSARPPAASDRARSTRTAP